MIALLSVSLFFLLNTGLQELFWYSSGRFVYDDDDFKYCLEEGDYPQLIYMLAQNSRTEEQPTEHTEEFSALAEYYQAASLYKAYIAANNENAAAEQKKIMDERASEITEYKEHMANIHNMLGLHEE